MFRWMGDSKGRPAQEQGPPPPPTPQPNTTMPQTQRQIEMGSGASTGAAAYLAQVPATGGPNVSNEIRVTFPSGAPLGVGLVEKDGEVVVDSVQPTSAAAAVPIGAIIQDVSGASCKGKSMREVMMMLARATMIADAENPLTATFRMAVAPPSAAAMRATPTNAAPVPPPQPQDACAETSVFL